MTCLPCLTEAVWLLRASPHAFEGLLRGFDEGLLELAPIDQRCLPWVSQFMRRYRNIGAQLADACLCYLAGGLKIDTVFTLDRRDFQVYRRRVESRSNCCRLRTTNARLLNRKFHGSPRRHGGHGESAGN